MKPTNTLHAVAALALPLALATHANAIIVDVVETGLGGDNAAIIEPADFGGFDEDTLTFSDRTHEHNGAAFNSGTGLLSTSGDQIVPLPDYLVGNDYVRFANNARENAGYEAVITTDVASTFFLLVDNRVDGPAGNNSSPNSQDPVLGGSLQWVLDGGWQRVNSGISPNGQADYTGVDEGGNGAGGPGSGLNQFYSVYRLPGTHTSATVQNNGIGGNNMISVVVAEGDVVITPTYSFTLNPGRAIATRPITLNWLVPAGSTSVTIDNGVGDVTADTTNGIGSVTIEAPAADTTYTITYAGGAEDGSLTADVSTVPAVFKNNVTFLDNVSPVELAVDPLGEDVLNYTDRVHEWNVIPDFLVDADWVKLGNNDKNSAAFEVTFEAAVDATFFLLLDNRIGNVGGSGASPVLGGGVMDWVFDSGFEDSGVDMGIDEGGDGDIDQTYSIFFRQVSADETFTFFEQADGGGRNMYGIAGVSPQITPVNIDAAPLEIIEGDSATISWTIPAGAGVTATIDNGVGNVADDTDPATGLGSVDVSPTTTTTYTLTYNSGGGPVSLDPITITVFPDPGPAAPRDDLVIWYPLDEAANEFIAEDASGNDNAADLLGNANFAPGQGVSGGAVFLNNFDLGAQDGYLDTGDLNDLEFPAGQSWTVSMWVNIEFAPAATASLFTKSDAPGGNANQRIAFNLLTNGQLQIETHRTQGNPQALFNSGVSVDDAQWHLVTAVRDSLRNNLHIYIDGVEANSLPIGPGDTNGEWSMGVNDKPGVFGRRNDNGFVEGLLDDIAVWRRALSPDEIAAIHSDGLSSFLGVDPPATEGFNITAIDRDPLLGEVTITFESEAGATYNLQRSTDLETWTNIGGDITGAAGTTQASDLTPPAATTVAYRIVRQ